MNKSSVRFAVACASFAIASFGLQTGSVLAQPQGLRGNYFGVTVDTDNAFGLGQEYLQQTGSPARWFVDQALEGAPVNANSPTAPQADTLDGKGFQGRIDLNNTPLSIRGKVSITPEASVVQPMVSYDLAIARSANIYAGAGYSFINLKDKSATIDPQNSFFVTAGAEAAVNDKVVIYGDAQYPLNQADFKINSPVKVQVGIGVRF